MRSDNRMVNRSLVLLLVAACVFIGYQAAGTRNSMVAQPTSVAVVQLKKVMDSIQQRAVIDMRLNELNAKYLEEEEEHKSGIENLETQLRERVGGDPAKARELATSQNEEYLELTEQLETAALNFAAWRRFTADTIDLEHALVIQDLYRSVKDSIRELAEAEGYDLVLIDDSQGELQVNPEAQMSREVQLTQQLSLRKILYARPAIDITDDVIVRMNNAYNAGQQP